MDDDELLDIASKLSSASDASKAQSQLSPGKPWLWLTGNRDALLQFAAAFVRAAASTIPKDGCRADPQIIDHRQISDGKTDYILGAAQRIDEFPESADIFADKKRREWHKNRLGLLGCALVGFVILFLLLSGFAFWWHIITIASLR